ncbi:MAG TPA: hypothetical protein VER11_07465 [Polyangiaceae bacterium]|nr:hypothetical protein [Polyangiaceae bacterium]
MYAKTRAWNACCSFVICFSALTSGCALDKKDDDADAFREAVPEEQSVALSGPDSSSASSTAAVGPTRRTLGTTPATQYAKWYGFTREMRRGVNQVTAGVLAGVWTILHVPPSAISKDSATWGPYTDELEPASYRFRITRIADDEYDYTLDGRPKASANDADFRAVLTGHGYGKPHALHGQGGFTIDLDVAKSLDPFAHPNDSGTVHIDYELPHDFDQNPDFLPRSITAKVDPEGEAEYTVESLALVDHTGSIHVDAHVDIADTKDTLLEDVVIDSRWNATGAGRADIDFTGGDLPSSVPMVSAVECWGTDFTQSYYDDSVKFSPTVGDVSACVYPSK